MDLRAHFPVLENVSYLNAGSVGPVPREAIEAAEAELARQLTEGRGGRVTSARGGELTDQLRGRIAALLGATASEIALTGATTDGVNTVIGGLDLQPGDEVLTTDEEHPGLLAPLALARERRGITVRTAPFDDLAAAVDADTTLVAASHISWLNGKVLDTAALRDTGVPVLLDGAQSIGAVPVDVRELGCDFYAASGQKWLCGPVGSGYLYVREDRIGTLHPIAPGYGSLDDPLRALDLPLRAGAARFDTSAIATHQIAWALASLDVLERPGLQTVQAHAADLAERLVGELVARGRTVADRGRSTLVSWESPDPEAETAALLERGYLVRSLPGTSYVRASVGGWSTEEELLGLAEAAATSS